MQGPIGMEKTIGGGKDFVETLRRGLSVDEPVVSEKDRQACVAVIIVRGEDGFSVLMIKRAERDGDAWSGQMAFPGGKREKEDRSYSATAERETLEEVGIDLAQGARFIGYMEPRKTKTGSIVVVPSVFVLDRKVEARPNEEVASFVWVPVRELSRPENSTTYRDGKEGAVQDMPAVAVGGHVVWGLTYEIIGDMLRGWVGGS